MPICLSCNRQLPVVTPERSLLWRFRQKHRSPNLSLRSVIAPLFRCWRQVGWRPQPTSLRHCVPEPRRRCRYRTAAHRGEWRLGSAQGSSGRHVTREHSRHKGFHGTPRTGTSERVHRSLRRTSAHRVPGHPLPDQPDAQSRCCAGRSRANAPVGRYWLSPRDGGTSRGSAFAIG